MESWRSLQKSLVYRFFRPALSPNLQAISRSVESTWQDPKGFLTFFFERPSDRKVEYANEYGEIETRLAEAAAARTLRYPRDWRMEPGSASALYSLLRTVRPETVLETGVANGDSSVVILKALEKNGRGRLTSVDVADDVGSLVPAELKPRWNRVILQRPHERNFRKLAASLGSIDVFLHDSCHEYHWQTLEFEEILKHVSSSGLLLSDDIDWSYAFIDFVSRHHLKAAVLVGARKMFGAIKVGNQVR